ncbi:MAG: hypothetical protein IPG76_16550 [Acidobacteria bacterium]|nr:hypothetical protein [Acidobacteriota bacterium]
MFTSRKLAHVVLAMFALILMSVSALAADPGQPYPAESEASDQKAGSLLVYNYYTSTPGVNNRNTRVNITNTNAQRFAYVHLFFISETCAVADYKTDLTPNQTFSFLVSDYDPGFSGYIIALAENPRTGLPVRNNWLIGDEYFKAAIGSANLGAIAFSALWQDEQDYPDYNGGPTITVQLNGVQYNRAAATVAADNIPSKQDLNDTTIILNSLRGDLTSVMGSVGTMFGLLYDDVEVSYSFSINVGCHTRVTLSDTTPRTAPRFTTVIPAGRTGWMKLYTNGANALVGAMVNSNPNTESRPDVFNGGHNLHHLTLSTNGFLTIPVFPQ